MTDEAKILIDEAGCSERVAEKILRIYGNNLNMAFRWLASRHKNLVVLKIKFATKSSYNCGMLFIVLNASQKRILRFAVSISQNPYVFSSALSMPWPEFENKIYTQRLSEEIVHEKTVAVTQAVRSFFQDGDHEPFFAIFDSVDYAEIERSLKLLLTKILNEDVIFEFRKERISVSDFRQISSGGKITAAEFISRSPQIKLKIEVVRGRRKFLFTRAVTIEKISAGTLIFVRITDGREIARYLARMIGVTGEDEVPVEVLEKTKKENGYFLTVRLGGMIKGICEVPFKTPLEIFRG
ncbi:MAG: hypothetical protein ABIH68_02175 [bacterium]